MSLTVLSVLATVLLLTNANEVAENMIQDVCEEIVDNLGGLLTYPKDEVESFRHLIEFCEEENACHLMEVALKEYLATSNSAEETSAEVDETSNGARGRLLSYTSNPKWASCEAGWKNIEGDCFKYITNQLNFDEAESYCQRIHSHAHVATIKSEEQNNRVADMAGSHSENFIGFIHTAGGLTWASGAEVTYTGDWHEQTDSDVQCTRLMGSGHSWKPRKWDDWPCSNKDRFFCSYSPADAYAEKWTEDKCHNVCGEPDGSSLIDVIRGFTCDKKCPGSCPTEAVAFHEGNSEANLGGCKEFCYCVGKEWTGLHGH